MDKNLDADTKKIGKFLKGLNEVEYRYLELCMHVVSGIKLLFKRHELTKKRFIELFGINDRDYNNYIGGNYNYKISDMAKLNHVHDTLEIEKINNK